MEKTVRIIEYLKWLCLPLGGIMYLGTYRSFGTAAGCFLGAAAGAAFWILMRSERSRLIGQTIASEIKEAILSAANVESLIEIKRLKSGIIARVYLINAREKASDVQNAVARRMENCTFKKYLWVMQLTDMPGREALRETQRMLNDQLVEELLRRRREDE
ncbi:MAG: hypothetical protein ACI4LA_10365 [Emergencia sp.]